MMTKVKHIALLAAVTLVLPTSGTLAQQQTPSQQRPPAPWQMGPEGMGHGDRGPWMMGHGMKRGMMMNPGTMQSYAEGHLAFLKSELAITHAQSGAWNAYADAVRAQAKSMAEMYQKMSAAMGQTTMTPPQHYDLHIQMMEERLATMKKARPTVDALYQALTPEQRQKADQLFDMPCCRM